MRIALAFVAFTALLGCGSSRPPRCPTTEPLSALDFRPRPQPKSPMFVWRRVAFYRLDSGVIEAIQLPVSVQDKLAGIFASEDNGFAAVSALLPDATCPAERRHRARLWRVDATCLEVRDGRVYDRVTFRCRSTGATAALTVDVTSFFAPTDGTSRESMDADEDGG